VSPEEVRRGVWVGDSGPSTPLVVEMLSPWVVLKQLKKYMLNAEAGEGSAVESPSAAMARRRQSMRLSSARNSLASTNAHKAGEPTDEDEERALMLRRAMLSLRRHSSPVFWNCVVMFREYGLFAGHLLMCAVAPSMMADDWLEKAQPDRSRAASVGFDLTELVSHSQAPS